MAENSATPPTPEELKSALKAFRKRLNVMVLDKESRSIHGPLSSGKKSGIVAIRPPTQFRQEIWDALAKQGKLVYAGNGLYEMGKQ